MAWVINQAKSKADVIPQFGAATSINEQVLNTRRVHEPIHDRVLCNGVNTHYRR